jgi:hypothetical protein
MKKFSTAFTNILKIKTTMSKKLLFSFFLTLYFAFIAHAGCIPNLNQTGGRNIFCTGEIVVLTFNIRNNGSCDFCNQGTYTSTSWSNGVIGDSIIVTQSGTYTANITSVLCSYSHTFNITFVNVQKPAISLASNLTLPGCGSINLADSLSVSQGTPPYSYNWSSGPTVSGFYLPTTFTLYVTDALGCQNQKSVTVTPELTAPITQPQASLIGCQVSCEVRPNFTYQWYCNGQSVLGAMQTYFPANQTGNWYANYQSTLYPLCSVNSNTVYKEPFNNQEICIVTVDSATNRNLIVWEKTPNVGIDKFRVYKQNNITSLFDLVAEQPYNQFSSYTDINSSPSQVSAKYQISIVDICGDESTKSSEHQTILLSSNLGINNTVNLNWNSYAGFSYNNFEIWRSANSGPFYLLSNVANTTYAYVDNNPPTTSVYQIRVVNPNGCVPTAKTNSYAESRSNLVDKAGNNITGINYQEPQLDFFVSPNPFNNTLQVNYDFPTNQNNPRLVLTDILGRELKEIKLTGQSDNVSINTSDIPKGTIIVSLYGGQNMISKKVIKID